MLISILVCILQSLSSEFQKESSVGLCSAVQRHLQEAEAAKTAGAQHWYVSTNSI